MPIEAAALAEAHPRPQFTFKDCTYIAIRPTFEHGDHTISAFLDDHEDVQLEIGLPDVPTQHEGPAGVARKSEAV